MSGGLFCNYYRHDVPHVDVKNICDMFSLNLEEWGKHKIKVIIIIINHFRTTIKITMVSPMGKNN